MTVWRPWIPRARVAVAVMCTSLVLHGALGAMQPVANRLALVGGMLLDGYDAPPIHYAAVLIDGNRIIEVGPAAELQIPPDYTVVDTTGRTMMPGLIDLHPHLLILGHGDYGRWFFWIEQHGGDAMRSRIMAISAKQLLMAGVTSAVDLGAPFEISLDIRGRIKRGEMPGPRLSMSAPWITRSRGRMTSQFGGITITTSAEAARETEKLIDAGVDVIKAHSGLTLDDYRSIVRVAHDRNVRVHAHVYAERDVKNALDAGVDVLTHAGSAGTAPPYSADLLTDIVNAGRPIVVTAAHRSWIYQDTIAFPERLQDPQLRSDLPPETYQEVQDSFSNWRALRYFARTDREIFFRERGLKQFIESGAVMGMGTESGTPMNFHTEALWREAKAHVDMGMSTRRVISALTRVGASILGKSTELSTIEPGKLADIIVLRGNPHYDIMALAHVETVVKDGRVVREPKGY